MKKASLNTIYKEQHGFTIIELMVGIVIAVIISAAAFTALTSSSKATRVNDQTAQTQQSARLAMELISHDIKMAGYGMTGPVGNCATAIVPADNNVGGADTGPDSISLVVPTVTSNLVGAVTGPTSLSLVSASGFLASSVISIGGAASATVTSLGPSGNNIPLVSTVAAPATFPDATPVSMIQCVTYQVIRSTDTNASICGGSAPCLARGVGVPLLAGKIDCNAGIAGAQACTSIAEGIEDLQVAYACDGCNALVNGGIADTVIDDQGVINVGTFDTGDFVSDNNWATTPITPDTIRLVMVSIVAREARTEQGLGGGNIVIVNTAVPLTVIDHNPSADAGYVATAYQQFRRRFVTRTIEVRNIGL